VQAETRTPDPELSGSWSLWTRIAFRLCFLYFGFYVLLTQMLPSILPLPGVEPPSLGTMPPVRQVVEWTARHIFGIGAELVVTDSGSGDKLFDWVQAFCLIVLVALGTAVWSILDRERRSYARLHRGFCLFLRLALGATMLLYGFDKLIPLQMPFPYLSRLVEPFGNFSPMGVLWYSIGASPAYEMFLGGMEVLTGLLVIVPQTATLGALLCLLDSVQVFVFNMTYDVPVKLFSFHLILMCLFLLAPEAPRLCHALLLNREAASSRHHEVFRGARSRRIGTGLQLLFAVCLVALNLDSARKAWTLYGRGSPKSPLYGIWSVEQMLVDGEPRPPLLTDQDRWRRVLFQDPKTAIFQRMDDSFARFVASIDVTDRRLSLTKRDDKTWEADFRYERSAPDRLALDGSMDRHRIQLQLVRQDEARFLLVSRGFHWVQEYPFNR